jgi:hypothetical protein
VAFHVHALALIPVPAGPVAAAVDHSPYGLDPEIAVAPRLVAGQLRRRVIGVEAVASRAFGNVTPEPGVPGLVADVHPVLPGPAD